MTPEKKNMLIGYAAGIVSGATYGLNPVFGKPLLADGVSVTSMLFFRYAMAAVMLALMMKIEKVRFKVGKGQFAVMTILGLLFTGSSLLMFDAYKYIPSGEAATIVYLYPVFTALVMIFMKEYPSWKTVLAIVICFAGVCLLCMPGGGVSLNMFGVGLSVVSALCYALYLVVVNKSKRIGDVSVQTLTLYALITGATLLLILNIAGGHGLMTGISGAGSWLNIVGMAFFPTVISMVGLSVATRRVGATKAAILGVFEPITAIIFGIILFNEPMTFNILSGILICLTGITFMTLSKGK